MSMNTEEYQAFISKTTYQVFNRITLLTNTKEMVKQDKDKQLISELFGVIHSPAVWQFSAIAFANYMTDSDDIEDLR